MTGRLNADEVFASDIKPTFTLTEVFQENLVFNGDYNEAKPNNDLNVNVKVSMQGLNPGSFNENTPFSVNVGSFSFAGFLGDGTYALGGTSSVITFEETNSVSYEEEVIGTLTLSWNSSTLRCVLNVDDQETFAVIAPDYSGFEGDDFVEEFEASFQFADRYLEPRQVYLTGTGGILETTSGGEDWSLARVRFVGGYDTTKPTVKIMTPKAAQKVFLPTVSVQGEADDNVEVSQVFVSVNNGPFTLATGEVLWHLDNVPLNAGANKVQAKSVDQDGNESTVATRNFTYSLLSSLKVSVVGQGTVTSALSGTTQHEVGAELAIKAVPAVGWAFGGWTGDVVSSTAKLVFQHEPEMSLVANFVPGPFVATEGKYNGLALPPASTVPASGFVKLNLNILGKVKGTLTLGGEKLKFIGKFKPDGTLKKKLFPAGKPAVTLQLAFNPASPNNTIAGTVTQKGATVADVMIYRDVFTASGNPAPQAGTYSVVLDADGAGVVDPNAPTTNGSATITVDAEGLATIAGTLANGAAFSAKATLSDDGILPVYKSLGKGVLIGELLFSNQPGSDVEGPLRWQMLQAPAFSTNIQAIGNN